MKKTVLLFAATVLFTLTTKAQLNKSHEFAYRDLIRRILIKHDTRNNYLQGLKAAEFQKLDSAVTPNVAKDYYIYDNDRRNTQHISYVWVNTRWVNLEKEEFTYGTNGNVLSALGYTWNTTTDQWVTTSKYELTYTNNLVSLIKTSEWTNNQWTDQFKIEFTYLNGIYSSQIAYTWNKITLQWDNTWKFGYTYDGLSRRILKEEWMWSNNNWSDTKKTTYAYDANSNMNLSYDSIWDSTTSEWMLYERGEYTYDASKRLLSAIHAMSIGPGLWLNSRKSEYTYAYTVSPNNLILPYFQEDYADEDVDINAASYTYYQWNFFTWVFSSKNDKYFSDFVLSGPLLTVSTNALTIGSSDNSTATFNITSNLNWTAASNETWLTISNESGTGNSTITLTATANPNTTPRTATVTVSATGVPSQNIVVTQGVPGIVVNVFLEGAYAGAGLMSTTLKTGALLTLSQPYNITPWNYAGTETVTSIPADVVDWVLVELRQAATPEAALPGTTTLPGWPKACFLKSNGSIVDLDGITPPALGNPTITTNLYVIIRHRNHIAIMSAAGMTLTGSNYVYNFTDALSKAHGGSSGYKGIAAGVFGMVSGDADPDGNISILDFTKWATDYGQTSIYLPSDIDADGEVSVLDFSKWATNFGAENIPPLKKMSLDGSASKYRSQVPGSN